MSISETSKGTSWTFLVINCWRIWWLLDQIFTMERAWRFGWFVKPNFKLKLKSWNFIFRILGCWVSTLFNTMPRSNVFQSPRRLYHFQICGYNDDTKNHWRSYCLHLLEVQFSFQNSTVDNLHRKTTVIELTEISATHLVPIWL